ncbi:MAG: integrase core domain-containing protein, partial [Victivallaceae bacterium]|nr:integrase core domain-containing protein [Victivallaceae bacterium]
ILFPNAYSKLRACKNPPCYTLKDNLHEQNISHKMALTDRLHMWDGFLLGKKYLIHDRDSLFNKWFDSVFESIGITIKKLPPFTPQMNARMANFIRAIKTECLDKMIFTSEAQLRLAVKEYLEYWNHYRPHAGLEGKLVMPYPQDMTFPIKEVSFLGGLLHGYRR